MGLFDALRSSKPKEPPKRRVTKVKRDLLQLIFAASRDSLPDEFVAALRAEGDTLTELVVMPAIQGRVHAIPNMQALPTDRHIVGTVHSHPSGVPLPSGADKNLFAHFGHTHIIVGAPYAMHTWRAYDHQALSVRLEVVD